MAVTFRISLEEARSLPLAIVIQFFKFIVHFLRSSAEIWSELLVTRYTVLNGLTPCLFLYLHLPSLIEGLNTWSKPDVM